MIGEQHLKWLVKMVLFHFIDLIVCQVVKLHGENVENLIKSIKQIKKSIDNTAMKNNIMTELMEVYMLNNNLNNDFTKKLDNNNYLIGFNNGVFDLEKFEFRDGLRNQY